MKTVYMLRHQAGGLLAEWLFLASPTEDQMKPIHDLMVARHGVSHPKTREVYWLRVENIPVLVNEIPCITAQGTGERRNRAAAAAPVAQGFGTVKPR